MLLSMVQALCAKVMRGQSTVAASLAMVVLFLLAQVVFLLTEYLWQESAIHLIADHRLLLALAM